MIVYFVTSVHSYTILSYLNYWAPELTPDFNVLAYKKIEEGAARRPTIRLPAGTYIFSDLDRLSDRQEPLVAAISAAAQRAGVKVLNDPQRTLGRYELLKTLYERGINSFDVYAADGKPRRFPVFVRRTNGHGGTLTELIYSQSELDRRIEYLRANGMADTPLMVVEYVDVADSDGVFRKYGCHLVGDSFVPDHLFFSRKWMTKLSDNSASEELLREERDFVYQPRNPHEAEIRRVFEIANIAYGRIDYGMVDGKIQVWEINTNPMITGAPEEVPANRLALKKYVHSLMNKAFYAINDARSGQIVLACPDAKGTFAESVVLSRSD